jgi:hypothetical protein
MTLRANSPNAWCGCAQVRNKCGLYAYREEGPPAALTLIHQFLRVRPTGRPIFDSAGQRVQNLARPLIYVSYHYLGSALPLPAAKLWVHLL